jgi:hypothetical protein
LENDRGDDMTGTFNSVTISTKKLSLSKPADMTIDWKALIGEESIFRIFLKKPHQAVFEAKSCRVLNAHSRLVCCPLRQDAAIAVL